MPIPVVCGSCAAKLVAPDAAAGKKVKCRKCQAVIAVPTPAVAEEESDFEFVEPSAVLPASRSRRADPRQRSEVQYGTEGDPGNPIGLAPRIPRHAHAVSLARSIGRVATAVRGTSDRSRGSARRALYSPRSARISA